jgi:hypothetical protein
MAGLCGWGQGALPGGGRFGDRTFDFYHEFHGQQAWTNPEAAANLRSGMANGVSFQPPLEGPVVELVRSRGVNLMADPLLRLRRDLSVTAFDGQRQMMEQVAGQLGGNRMLWNLMPEWDQSGGSWVPDGRPQYTGLPRAQAYTRFFDYYLKNYPGLAFHRDQPAAARKYWLTSITDHSPNAVYAYEMGADICVLERGIDELGDISTGIAFVRGAARQYDRQWGIDVATFRTGNNMATRFDERGTLVGGWSPSYLKRHNYLAYMAGAHVLRNQATVYYNSAGQLNPFGRMTQEFADFALRRHADVGRPRVTMGLLVDHYSGFDPKHWIYNQWDAVWYQDIPYSDGDRMINNFLRLAYPDHWLHGQTPGAPFNDAAGKADEAAFQSFLARGGDPRPYEPMGTTRYGHSLEVITDRVRLEAMRAYPVIVMLGNVPVDGRLREELRTWVAEGGTLVTSTSQQAGFDESFLGARPATFASRSGNWSTWIADWSTYREGTYVYTPLTATTATVIAYGENYQPLITMNRVGKGRVILSGAPYIQTAAKDRILAIGTRLFDWLAAQNTVAVIEGEPVEYIVNEAPGRVIVTVVNNSGSEWTGTIVVSGAGAVTSVREYVGDGDAGWLSIGGKIRVAGTVPAYDVRVFAVEFEGR